MYYAYESSLFSCLDWLILPGSHLSRHNMQWGGSNPSCLQRDQKQCACAVCYQLFNLVPRGPFCHARRILDSRRWPKRSRLLGTRLPAVPLLARFTGLVKLVKPCYKPGWLSCHVLTKLLFIAFNEGAEISTSEPVRLMLCNHSSTWHSVHRHLPNLTLSFPFATTRLIYCSWLRTFYVRRKSGVGIK